MKRSLNSRLLMRRKPALTSLRIPLAALLIFVLPGILAVPNASAFNEIKNDEPRPDPWIINGCTIKPKTVCRSVDLRHADLKQADLSGADLSGADLEDADLTGAELFGADLSTAKGLVQAQLDLAKGDPTTRVPEPLVVKTAPRRLD